MYVVIVAELANNITDVYFPDPNGNLRINNSIFIPASYIQQRSSSTGKHFPQHCEYIQVTA